MQPQARAEKTRARPVTGRVREGQTEKERDGVGSVKCEFMSWLAVATTATFLMLPPLYTIVTTLLITITIAISIATVTAAATTTTSAATAAATITTSAATATATVTRWRLWGVPSSPSAVVAAAAATLCVPGAAVRDLERRREGRGGGVMCSRGRPRLCHDAAALIFLAQIS